MDTQHGCGGGFFILEEVALPYFYNIIKPLTLHRYNSKPLCVQMNKTWEFIEKVCRRFRKVKENSPVSVESGQYCVREISSKKEVEESVRFSWKVYQGYPAWVPYFLINDQVKLISGDYLYSKKVRSKRFLVERNGNTVGTISAFADNYFNRYHGKNVGFLGFFESLPDREEAVGLLLDKATEFLEQEGCKEIWAPVNGIFGLFGGGLLSSGFEKTPSFLQIYTPPYYHDYFIKAGFQPIKRLLHYSIDLTLSENLNRIKSLSEKSLPQNINIRRIDKSRWNDEARSILKIFNEAFAHLWGNVPFDYDEFVEFASEFKSLIIPDFWLIAEVDGEPSGFVGGFPQYATIFREIDGKMNLLKMLKLPIKSRRIKEGVILLACVLSKCRGRGIGQALLSRSAKAMIEKGYSAIGATWILEDNINIRRVIEGLGGEVDLSWTVYGRNQGI